MAEVKWIKITTNMFEDEKIDFIESLPEADAILVIWIKLLAQAGKCNANGFIFLTEKIPYSFDMLAHKFRRPINVIKLALSTFTNLGMIEMDDQGYISIANWEKHQNIEGLDKIREQARLRKAKQRERDKQILIEDSDSNVPSHVTVTLRHAIEQELEEEQDIDKEQQQAEKRSFSSSINENIAKISSVFEENGFGTLNITVKDMLVTLLEDYPAEWIIEALKIAVKNNKRTLRYVEGILQNWRVDGGMKLESDKKDKKPTSQGNSQAKKTRFHNFEQVTDKYTSEELEDVAAKKRKEHSDKLKTQKNNK